MELEALPLAASAASARASASTAASSRTTYLPSTSGGWGCWRCASVFGGGTTRVYGPRTHSPACIIRSRLPNAKRPVSPY